MAAEKKAQEDAKVPQEYKVVAAKDAAMRAEFKAENERVRSIAAQYNKAKQEARAREQAKKDAAIQKQTERVAIAQAGQVARTAAAANIAQPLISGVATPNKRTDKLSPNNGCILGKAILKVSPS